MKEAPTTAKEARAAEEKKLREKDADVPFPGFDRLFAESLEAGPKVAIVIADARGQVVRRLEGPAKAGVHRINWDLRGPSPEPIDLTPPGWVPPWADSARGPLVAPGRYTATLMLVSTSGVRTLGKPQSFEVKPVNNLAEGTDPAAVAAFQQEAAELRRRAAATSREIAQARDDVRHMRAALVTTPKADPALRRRVDDADKTLAELSRRLDGDPVRGRLNESTAPSISDRVFSAMSTWETRQMPTATQRRDAEVAGAELGTLIKELDALVAGELKALGAALEAAGAPWTPRRRE